MLRFLGVGPSEPRVSPGTRSPIRDSLRAGRSRSFLQSEADGGHGLPTMPLQDWRRRQTPRRSAQRFARTVNASCICERIDFDGLTMTCHWLGWLSAPAELQALSGMLSCALVLAAVIFVASFRPARVRS